MYVQESSAPPTRARSRQRILVVAKTWYYYFPKIGSNSNNGAAVWLNENMECIAVRMSLCPYGRHGSCWRC